MDNNNTIIKEYNTLQNKFTDQPMRVELLLSNFNSMVDLDSKKNINNLDVFFNKDIQNKFPPVIICNDIKNANQSEDIYKKYMDVITDECNNRFNIHDTRSSAGILQAGYSANIDLDSHLKNINYYKDKCYYDNWKLAPNSKTYDCLGINRNATILTPDYTPVGRNYNDSLCVNITNKTNTNTNNVSGNNNNNNNNNPKWNTPPTDINCETNIRKRYVFDNNKLQKETCIKPNEWKPFIKVTASNNIELNNRASNNTETNNISNTTKRLQKIVNTITPNQQHDYYKFFDNNNCTVYPNQRLFNNITKMSMLPNHHFTQLNI